MNSKIFFFFYSIVFACQIQGIKYYLTEKYELSAEPLEAKHYSPDEAGVISAMLDYKYGEGIFIPTLFESRWID